MDGKVIEFSSTLWHKYRRKPAIPGGGNVASKLTRSAVVDHTHARDHRNGLPAITQPISEAGRAVSEEERQRAEQERQRAERYAAMLAKLGVAVDDEES
jgi:hypothetical protein